MQHPLRLLIFDNCHFNDEILREACVYMVYNRNEIDDPCTALYPMYGCGNKRTTLFFCRQFMTHVIFINFEQLLLIIYGELIVYFNLNMVHDCFEYESNVLSHQGV